MEKTKWKNITLETFLSHTAAQNFSGYNLSNNFPNKTQKQIFLKFKIGNFHKKAHKENFMNCNILHLLDIYIVSRLFFYVWQKNQRIMVIFIVKHVHSWFLFFVSLDFSFFLCDDLYGDCWCMNYCRTWGVVNYNRMEYFCMG